MSILIGADFVPTSSNVELFKNGDIDQLFGLELLKVLKDSDIRIFNLEVPLVDKASPIQKCGPNLIAPISTIQAFVAIETTILSMANNHIMDQGNFGLESSIKLLESVGIDHVGCGINAHSASQVKYFFNGNRKYGIYACVEHEFSVAKDDKPGANGYDPLYTFDHILEAKEQCDYLIVLYHGGKEHYRYPSPELQRTCRKMIEKGADLVLCQHSHCIGCKEEYCGGTIVYGQGNFLFDHSTEECWKTGLLVRINDDSGLEYLPVVKKDNVVRLANNEEKKDILADFNRRSQEIKDTKAVNERYQKFVASILNQTMLTIGGKETFLFRVANKITRNRLRQHRIRMRYSTSELLKLLNRIECESWREITVECLKNLIKQG